jgi:hypothetical protein
LILEFALQIFQRLRHRAGRIVSHSQLARMIMRIKSPDPSGFKSGVHVG